MSEQDDLVTDILDRTIKVFKGLCDDGVRWTPEILERFEFRLRDALQFALGKHLEEVDALRRELCRRVIQEGKAHD